MSLGPLGLIFLLKYSPGISHNLCTKVRGELDEICLMTVSWEALSRKDGALSWEAAAHLRL